MLLNRCILKWFLGIFHIYMLLLIQLNDRFLGIREIAFLLLLFNNRFSFFWPNLAACGILVPWTGIKSVPPALEAWCRNHWSHLTREVLGSFSSISWVPCWASYLYNAVRCPALSGSTSVRQALLWLKVSLVWAVFCDGAIRLPGVRLGSGCSNTKSTD